MFIKIMMLFFICLAVYFLMNTLLSVEMGLFVFSFMVFILWSGLLKNWNHLIMILMLMEMMMLCAFVLLMFNTGVIYNMSTMLIFSCFMVVEASAGLSILTLISRSHGNDFMLIF